MVGGFSLVNGPVNVGQPRNRAAAVNTTTAIATACTLFAGSQSPSTVAVAGSTVFLGGDFSIVRSSSGNVIRANAAAVDARTGFDLGWNPGFDGDR